MSTRRRLKAVLATAGRLDRSPPVGATLLIWHRVGGGTGDELDLPVDAFVGQLDALVASGLDVVPIDTAVDRLLAGDPAPSVVLTFDDGFADVATAAHPHLAARSLPYTLYLAAGLVGGAMRWEGSSAASQGAPALTWEQVGELHASGLCTIGNHTFSHAGPDTVDAGELDRASDLVETVVGERPRHFAWTWGVPVPALRPAVAERFRSAATGELGRNRPGADPLALRRVPVRATDPPAFFAAKLHGRLLPERAYAAAVATAKAARRVTGAVRRG